MRVFASWSGGKDSAMATYRAVSQGHQVLYLLNFIAEDGKRSRSHGLKAGVLALQAAATGIPLIQVRTSWEDYEQNFREAVMQLKEKGIEGALFGDIDIEGHREWLERVCAELKIEPILPLWGVEPGEFLAEFWRSGFKAKVVATKLDKGLLGKDLDKALLVEIQKFNSHPCGENGEYHTFVTDGPIFGKPLKVALGRQYWRDNVWFSDISAQIVGANSGEDV
jgi:diphthine-ammonia ligase